MSERYELGTRHVEVLQALADGLDAGQVAQRLGVGKEYVWKLTHEAKLILGATSRVQTVVIAVELGYVRVQHGQGSRLARAREHLAAAVALMGA